MTRFGAASTALEVVEGIDLTGKRAIVTGGASGLPAGTLRLVSSPLWPGALMIECVRVAPRAPGDVNGWSSSPSRVLRDFPAVVDHPVHALHAQAHHGSRLRPRGADRLRVGDDALRRVLTIPISHFCEKARWALERAGLDYVEEHHVQGVHRFASRRAGGHGTLPVMVCADGVFAGSEWIVRYADGHLPPRERLFTGDPEVETLCRWLDGGLGPDGRRLMYAHMLPRPELMLAYNNQGVAAWEARALTGLYPVAVRWARRELEITRPEDDVPRVLNAFDAIAERLSDGRRHLCGDRFTAADLTFASLAAAVVVPPEYGVPLPQPAQLPEPIARDVERFRAHPAGAYALTLFATKRRVKASTQPSAS